MKYTLGELMDTGNALYELLGNGVCTGAWATKEAFANMSDACDISGGTYYGGVFNGGVFNCGDFYGGIFNGGQFYEGEFFDGVFNGGQFYEGEFFDGVFNGGTFNGGSPRVGTYDGGVYYGGDYYYYGVYTASDDYDEHYAVDGGNTGGWTMYDD